MPSRSRTGAAGQTRILSVTHTVSLSHAHAPQGQIQSPEPEPEAKPGPRRHRQTQRRESIRYPSYYPTHICTSLARGHTHITCQRYLHPRPSHPLYLYPPSSHTHAHPHIYTPTYTQTHIHPLHTQPRPQPRPHIHPLSYTISLSAGRRSSPRTTQPLSCLVLHCLALCRMVQDLKTRARPPVNRAAEA